MSALSELVIRPAKSGVYLRLVLVLYCISLGLIVYSALFLLVKITLSLLVLKQAYTEYLRQSPCATVQKLCWQNAMWQLEFKNGQLHQYDAMTILIHNSLFQLILLTQGKKNTHLILFNDQIPEEQLRLLHLRRWVN